MRKTVKLKKYVDIVEEYPAHEVIAPGMLVELRSNGKVQRHASAASFAIPMFALEDELQGKSITQSYAVDDPVQVWVANTGEVVNALLQAGQTAVVGALLVSAGNGTLRVAAGAETQFVGQAVEALDLSGVGTVATHIAVRIV